MGFGVGGLGVWGFGGLGVWGFGGLGVWGFGGLGVWGFRVQGSGFRVIYSSFQSVALDTWSHVVRNLGFNAQGLENMVPLACSAATLSRRHAWYLEP